MLIDSKTERVINSIGIAENAKLEGISKTSRRILNGGDNTTIFNHITQGYSEFNEDIKNGEVALGTFRKVGFTVTLPYTLLLGFVTKIGADVRTLVAMAREEKNIATLVNNGIIKQEDVPALIGKVQKLDDSTRTMSADVALYQMEGGMSR
jgi:hypothetical protein